MTPKDQEALGENALDNARSIEDSASLDTLNEKRRATLAEIDSARFSCARLPSALLDFIDRDASRWFHVRVCLVAGAGFFTDA